MKLQDLPRPVIVAALRSYFRLTFNNRVPLRLQRRLVDQGARLQALRPGARIEPLTLGGRVAERITLGDPDATTAVLYLHGGGYTLGSIASHRSLATHLAEKSGAAIYLLDYRLAPEHPYPAALDDAVAAFRSLITDHEFSPEHIALAGDSAGGGLAAATALRLIDRHGLHPAALGLIAPWVDPSADGTVRRDMVINRPWGRTCARSYLGAGDPADPGYAPLLGNLSGLPPIMVQVGTEELLYGQAVEFVDKARAAGVDAVRVDLPTLWHVAQAQASFVPDAAAAVAQLAEFLRSSLDALNVEPRTGDVG